MPNLTKAEEFEKQELNKTFKQAMFGAFLHKGTAWLGAATLTWATVVLMGGFASEVPLSDFVQVTFLVVEIACLLALVFVTSKLVTNKILCRGSLDPVYLCYKDRSFRIITTIQCTSALVQFFLFILPCASMAMSSLQREKFKAIHFNTLLFSPSHSAGFTNGTVMVSDLQACLHKCASVSVNSSTITSVASCVQSCFLDPTALVSNLDVCLCTFFYLVMVTCILAFLCLVYVVGECFLWCKSELSLKKYHDEVMSRALNVGLVEAGNFDSREFFIRGLAEDLATKNIASLEVKRQNSKVVNYLFDHPNGVERVYQGLASEDTMHQQTAANIVGYWARRHNLEKNSVLLSKLAEKLGLAGKTAEAAANSFSALGVEWQGRVESPLLKIKVQCDGGNPCNVVEKVVDLVLRKRLPTLQVYIRLLNSFFLSQSVCTWLATNRDQDLQEMKVKLLSIVNQEEGVNRRRTRIDATNTRIDVSIRARTGFLAFSALELLNSLDNADLNRTQGTTSNAPISSDGGTNHINAALNNSHGTNNTSSAASTSSGILNNGDWHTQARELLLVLDGKLKAQEFMWYSEAERYRDLCRKFFGDESINLGTWLEPTGPCEIRGKEYEDML